MCAFVNEDLPSNPARDARRQLLLGYINRSSQSPAPSRQEPRLGFSDRLAQLRSGRAPRGSSLMRLADQRFSQLQRERDAFAKTQSDFQRQQEAAQRAAAGPLDEIVGVTTGA